MDEVLEQLGLTASAQRRPDELSNGERHLVALGRGLVSRPKVVLLDEPAAGLDPHETAELADVLLSLPGTGVSVVLVDHDMSVVLRVCDAVHVLDFGGLIASGTPAEIRSDPVVIAAYLGTQGLRMSDTAPPTEETAAHATRPTDRGGGIDRRLRRTPVVHGIDLHVDAGEVVALLGANGAGKTTTLLTMSGLLALQGGRVEVAGAELPRRRRARPADVVEIARRGVAHVPEDRGLFFDLTTAENLRLGRPRGRGAVEPLPMEQLLEWFPALSKVMDRPAGLLSGGEQQMVAIARAVLGRPRLLMVDEMSLGLAPIIVDRLLPVLRSIAKELEAGVLLVEQHVALVLAVSDRAYLMDRGTILASGPAAEMAERTALLESGYLGAEPTDPS